MEGALGGMLEQSDLKASVYIPAQMGADGLVWWGGPDCINSSLFWEYTNATMGPLVASMPQTKARMDAARSCSEMECAGAMQALVVLAATSQLPPMRPGSRLTTRLGRWVWQFSPAFRGQAACCYIGGTEEWQVNPLPGWVGVAMMKAPPGPHLHPHPPPAPGPPGPPAPPPGLTEMTIALSVPRQACSKPWRKNLPKRDVNDCHHLRAV